MVNTKYIRLWCIQTVTAKTIMHTKEYKSLRLELPSLPRGGDGVVGMVGEIWSPTKSWEN